MPPVRAAPDHPFFGEGLPQPLVIAHRGGSALWPENTLFAFQGAAAMGVDVLETDVHSTVDGALVLSHDPSVDRTTNGSGRINQLSLKQLKNLDAGYRWSQDGGHSFPFRNHGITVPTLEEAFSACPHMRFNIDIKQVRPSLIKDFCRAIRDFGMEARVMVASFSSTALGEFRRACPHIATSASTGEVRLFYLLTLFWPGAAFAPAGCYALQVPMTRGGLWVIARRFLNAAHRRNLQVHVWTVNEAAEMERFMRLGVDGIMTDYPDRLLGLVGRRPGI
jgi:glycerophosphoryl diester phosphodiesterase